MTDPFEHQLEIHRAIDTSTGAAGPAAPTDLAALPAYVPRAHDQALAQVVAQAADGHSRIAVLVGGSSTGKTRACWEALHPLRARAEEWRLWHPIDPTRPDAALADLERIGPYTVVWLNEAQFYLADPALGERVAAGLRELLRDPARAPVLVLATLWPAYWDALTTRSGFDAHAQARELLDGHAITVPGAFTDADLNALAGLADADPRLEEAAGQAGDGQVTQYLAGVPVLMDRYRQALPATRAFIHAAMDARRLGCGPHLPLALLAAAAPGYLTDAEWEQSGQDWLQDALEYVTAPCNGIPGILTAARSGIARNQRGSRTVAPNPQPGSGLLYRLADYLDQHGRRYRTEQIPPIDFWTAIAAHADPGDLNALGNAAWARGLYRDAVQLHKHATAHGNPQAAFPLVAHLHTLHPGDQRPAHWAAAHAALDDPSAVTGLLSGLAEVGALEQVAVLAERAAAHVVLDDPSAVAVLLHGLGEVGAFEQVAVLAERAAAHIVLDDPSAVAWLLSGLQEVGAYDRVAMLLAREPAVCVNLDDLFAVERLLRVLGEVGAFEQVAVLAERAAAHVVLDDPNDVAMLLSVLGEIGAFEPVAVLAGRAAAHIVLDEPYGVAVLLRGLQEVGAHRQVDVLTARLPAAEQFWLFLEISGNAERFRFGREPNGDAVAYWTWDDLE
ncbi:hypothetical protein GT755_00025 [Herbidospora sp. NEAU-GS84]|uniref:Tetratricopeptide repeat protein n=1 Tax=Herbidospora solisilvae TaxID=2696284 RepID=A0A7C9J5C5_9ACTN|nr:hypothetical protein [Herbidospora solisilvae]NAS20068.1 hypothetical protein [Herbidospora solisilvae]